MDTPVTIYSSPTCAFCHMAKQYLDSLNIRYKEVDITTNGEAAKWVENKVGYIATPVIDVKGTSVLGFDKPALDRALKAHQLTS